MQPDEPDLMAELDAAEDIVMGRAHNPGPKRMVGRRITGGECLSCGRPWPCDGSWQARAEAAEAALERVRVLAESFATASHPTLGGTFAATIGLRFLEAIKGSSEEPA